MNLEIWKYFFSGSDTPLPDLNIVVTDEDVGKNAEFDLVSLKQNQFSNSIFVFWKKN